MQTTSHSSALIAYGALTTAAMVWGGSVVAQKMSLNGFSPVEVSILRGIGALVILITIWKWQEGHAALSRHDLGILTLLGVGVLGNHLLVLYGLQYIGSGAAGIIIGSSPAITALLSSVLIHDIPFRTVWFGCTVSFIGVALVSGFGEDPTIGTHPWIGGTLIVLGLVSWALYTIGSRRVMERLSALTVNWTTLGISILFQIPLLWVNQKMLAQGLASVSATDWIALAYLIIFATAIGQQAWLFGVERVGPSRAGIFGNMIPLSALLFSYLILGEPIDTWKILGSAFILLGVWLVTRPSVSLS